MSSVTVLLMLVSAPAHAQSERVDTAHVKATLVSEVAEIAPNSSFWVGLRFAMRPGWHTYWLNPGDSGLATSIEWQLPEGMAAGAIRWPIPHRFPFGHLMNYGYSDEVVLLTRMSAWPPVTAAPNVVMTANAQWLVCDDICILEQGRFRLTLPVVRDGPAKDSEGQALIAEYVRLLPEAARLPAEFHAARETISLRVQLPPDWSRDAYDVWFYPKDYGVIDYAAPQPVNVDGNGIELTLVRGDLKHERLDRLRGVLVLRYGNGDERGIFVNAQPG